MTLDELQTLAESKDWNRFIFKSENQPDYLSAPVALNLTFDTMGTSSGDTQILLFASGEPSAAWEYPLSMALVGVTSAELTESSDRGDVLEITCYGTWKYIVIAS